MEKPHERQPSRHLGKKQQQQRYREQPFEYPEFKDITQTSIGANSSSVNSHSKCRYGAGGPIPPARLHPTFRIIHIRIVMPVFPGGDISFMQGISGIGTKTPETETTGPMGQKHIYYDYEKDFRKRYKTITLYFNFSGEE